MIEQELQGARDDGNNIIETLHKRSITFRLFKSYEKIIYGKVLNDKSRKYCDLLQN